MNWGWICTFVTTAGMERKNRIYLKRHFSALIILIIISCFVELSLHATIDREGKFTSSNLVYHLLFIVMLGTILWLIWRMRKIDAKVTFLFLKGYTWAKKAEKKKEPKRYIFVVPIEKDTTLTSSLEKSLMPFGFVVGVVMLVIYMLSVISPGISIPNMFILVMVTLFMTFIVPGTWHLSDYGFRYYDKKRCIVEDVGRYIMMRLRPILGLGAFVSFFYVLAKLELNLIVGFVILLIIFAKFYPPIFIATVLYRYYSENLTNKIINQEIRKRGIKEYKNIYEAISNL